MKQWCGRGPKTRPMPLFEFISNWDCLLLLPWCGCGGLYQWYQLKMIKTPGAHRHTWQKNKKASGVKLLWGILTNLFSNRRYMNGAAPIPVFMCSPMALHLRHWIPNWAGENYVFWGAEGYEPAQYKHEAEKEHWPASCIPAKIMPVKI